MEKIAVILPVYKNDKVPYVHLSIDSILNQTYKGKVTLYVGVDGSVDRDLCACLNEYESKGVKVRWFNENRGLAIVLNDLLDIVRKMDMSISPVWTRMTFLCLIVWRSK